VATKAATKTAYIVWNAGRSEGFVTEEYDDAWQASTGHFNAIRSTLGEAFHEAYPDEIEDSGEAREIEEIEVGARNG
jgi:hypothetical protein